MIRVFYALISIPRIILMILRYGRNNLIFTEFYVPDTLTKKNWGDDINIFFIELISGKKVVNFPLRKFFFTKRIRSYSLIGSIMTFYDLSNKIVWGTGYMDPDGKIKGRPYKVLSVRGPETRELLLKQGIDCPEVYGDPVLLLPKVYMPKTMRTNKGLIVPNMATRIDEGCIVELMNMMNLEVLDMTSYDEWTDVIDRIVSADFIVSESLHGLIVAETYGIPNVWVEFKEHPTYWDFKFKDYFASIGKSEKIMKLQNGIDVKMIENQVKSWNKGIINYDGIISSCPFMRKELNMFE